MESLLSVREVDRRLCAPGQPFEIETVEIDGREMRTWRYAPISLGEVLEQSREVGGERDLIVLGTERLTHERHFDLVQRLACALVKDLGVKKGDRVAIAMRNLPEWSVSFFAAAVVGAIAVPLNAFWNGSELAFAINDCSPKVLIADGERLARLTPHSRELVDTALVGTRLDDRKDSRPLPTGIVPFQSLLDRQVDERPPTPLNPDDPATIFYTSGTTSYPKGVLGTHRNVCSNLVNLMYVRARGSMRAGITNPKALNPASVVLVPVPLFHATGCHSNLLSQAYFGGTVILMRKWDPEEALQLIERERVNGVAAVPTMVWDLVNSPFAPNVDLSSLQSLGGGGAASPPELLRRIHQLLPECSSGTGYGMTEASSLTTSIGGADYAARPTSVGVPVPVCDVRIVDEEGVDVIGGGIGEIWIKGPTVVPGYWRRPEDTAATFTDGWLHSGDLGRVDDEGFLYIVDRAKDMVIRGGENISSIEVEGALFENPEVLEAAVFAVPHAVLGEEVGAVVRAKPNSTLTPEDLRSQARHLLAPFKVPTHIWLTLEPFPRGATGKIDKRALKAAYVPGL